MPYSIENALEITGKMLAHRGDYVGHGLVYHNFDGRSFYLCSYGDNDKLEHGAGDDVQINYVSGKEVSVDDLIEYLRKAKPGEWELDMIFLKGGMPRRK